MWTLWTITITTNLSSYTFQRRNVGYRTQVTKIMKSGKTSKYLKRAFCAIMTLCSQLPSKSLSGIFWHFEIWLFFFLFLYDDASKSGPGKVPFLFYPRASFSSVWSVTSPWYSGWLGFLSPGSLLLHLPFERYFQFTFCFFKEVILYLQMLEPRHFIQFQ